MLVSLLIFITIIILLFLLSMMWPPDSPWSPWWRTPKNIARIQCKLAKISKNDVIYDLGCGEGTALILAAKEFGARGVGVEIDLFRYWYAQIAIRLAGVSNQVTIVRKNFFDVDLSDASVVIMYLIPKTLNRLKPKLMQELKPKSRLVTFVYRIEDLPMIDKDLTNEVYVYEIPKKKK